VARIRRIRRSRPAVGLRRGTRIRPPWRSLLRPAPRVLRGPRLRLWAREPPGGRGRLGGRPPRPAGAVGGRPRPPRRLPGGGAPHGAVGPAVGGSPIQGPRRKRGSGTPPLTPRAPTAFAPRVPYETNVAHPGGGPAGRSPRRRLAGSS